MNISRRISTWATAASCAAALGCPPALGQNCGADIAGAQRIESPDYLVVFRTRPAKIRVGEHFTLEFALCPRGDRPGPETVSVDARMPEHRHGMNYKPTVKKIADRYEAEGLMFHMPGRWELSFDLHAGGKKEHLARSLSVK